MEEFKKLGLTEETIKVLEKKGFKKPTEVQEKTIPILLEGMFDVIAQAQTGTGKTACFGLPIIETIKENSKQVQAIILAPTRELAMQVATEIDSLKGNRRLNVLTIYGGASITNQIRGLRRGADIVVGTPGRVMDLIRRNELKLTNVSFAVLDEADEMLNMGFVEDIKWILDQIRTEKRMLMFSATMPREIMQIAKKFMREYQTIKVAKENLTIDLVEQHYYPVKNSQKYNALRRVIAVNDDFHGIIFCRTRANTSTLAQRLSDEKYTAEALHGDVTQAQREKILNRFRKKDVKVLVATDVAARGIDVKDLTHVINYSLPQSPEIYVHRIGRTGRAGKKGKAITFVMPSENNKLKAIERLIKMQLKKKELPTVNDVIETKKAKIFGTINNIISKGKTDEYDTIVSELLKENSPEKVIAAVLKYSIQNELSKNSYEDKKDDREMSVERERKRFGGRGSPRRDRGSPRRGRERAPRSRGGDRDSGRGRSSYGGDRDSSRGRSSYGGDRDSGRGRSSYGGDRDSSRGRSSYGGDRDSSRGRSSYGGDRDSSRGRSSYGGSREGTPSRERSFSKNRDEAPRRDRNKSFSQNNSYSKTRSFNQNKATGNHRKSSDSSERSSGSMDRRKSPRRGSF
jgi:ATP-dependent RNA helicase DeaD